MAEPVYSINASSVVLGPVLSQGAGGISLNTATLQIGTHGVQARLSVTLSVM